MNKNFWKQVSTIIGWLIELIRYKRYKLPKNQKLTKKLTSYIKLQVTKNQKIEINNNWKNMISFNYYLSYEDNKNTTCSVQGQTNANDGKHSNKTK